ncbi:nitroreductase family protein [Marinoscillum furvescens]|uniref:Putative NAD(P)H nitroreductase n=1 Tax=Marinoscillum furvescens DSM 4134 TaxID=1122208 RepID=A0A3D9LI93_MARFU|nr:nitroreductase [Marinoscillum furvescens]REE05543.1 nitroreductase [Marinoscillum furvescens DSM 4134]
MTIEEVHQLLQNRRSVYPNQYLDKVIPDQLIRNMLENANWAPTHKFTEPWRFKVIKGEVQKKFGIFMAEKYRSLHGLESFSVAKYEKLKMNPQRAGAIIAICMQRDPRGRVPEWEEVASVAMAVQNMWLTASAYGIGAYWSSPDLLKYFHEFEPLAEGEQCIGLFYMGYANIPANKPPRGPVEDKVKWLG